MTTGQLDALLAVAEHGSMNKAAESIYISQPALKKRLDALEDELGFALLQRSANGSSLTEAGETLCAEAGPLYAQLKAVVEKIQNTASPMRIRISQVSLLTLRFCDQLLAEFHFKHNNIAIERVFMTNDHWFDSLYSDEIDMCLVPGTNKAVMEWKRNGLTCIQYSEGQLACIVSRSHPLADNKEISMRELAPFSVFAEPLMMQYGRLAETAEKQGIILKTDQSVFSRYEMMDACREGMVYLHDISLTPDVFPLTIIPINDFSYGRFIILRNSKEPALRIMETYLLTEKGFQRK